MYDCGKEVLGHHDDKVTLPQKERDEMRAGLLLAALGLLLGRPKRRPR